MIVILESVKEAMNSFGIVLDELKKGGVGIDVKRRRDDGVIVDARDNELASLGTKATVASTAGLLLKLSPEEKLAWAIETKIEANALFKQESFREAMGKYVECLAGSDFGDKNGNSGNVDSLVIPVLCNLAACCIQVKEWGKAVSFAEQAVLLRPQCYKAILRKGIGLMHLGEHELAMDCFNLVQSNAIHETDTIKPPTDENTTTKEIDLNINEIPVNNTNNSTQHNILSEKDWARLPHLIIQTRRGLLQHKKQMKERKEALSKAFKMNSQKDDTSIINTIPTITTISDNNTSNDTDTTNDINLSIKNRKRKEKIQPMSIYELFEFIVESIINFILSFFRIKQD